VYSANRRPAELEVVKQAALEALGLEGYCTEKLSESDVGQMLGGGYPPDSGWCRWAHFVGRHRPRGGPCLRLRQRDEGVPRGPGGPPHQSG